MKRTKALQMVQRVLKGGVAFAAAMQLVACNAGSQAYELRRAAGPKFQGVSLETLSQCLGTKKSPGNVSYSEVCLELALIDSKLKSSDSMTVFVFQDNALVAYSAFKQENLSKWHRSLTQEDQAALQCNASEESDCKSLRKGFPTADVQKFSAKVSSETAESVGKSDSKSVIVVTRNAQGFQFREERARIRNGKKGPVALLKGDTAESKGFVGIPL